MIFRLEYCNKASVTARVDIQKGGSTPIYTVEGTAEPFVLFYNNDKGDKSGSFRSSGADINIYETAEFNIDELKTSNETEISVKYYINNVLNWSGFVIPDFFSETITGGKGVVSMVASDRLGTLKGATLSGLSAKVSNRELAEDCLAQTGLSLPLYTMADFTGDGTNIFNSEVLSQRMVDTKGRNVSCYDILSSILVETNSLIVQRNGAWYIVNKLQLEAGAGSLYSSPTTSSAWADSTVSFDEVSVGARRTIKPVAATVGVYHEHGGGLIYPTNHDFSDNLNGWTAVNGFIDSIDNRQVSRYSYSGGNYIPLYEEVGDSNYVVNKYNNLFTDASSPYLKSDAVGVIYPTEKTFNVEVEINATNAMLAATNTVVDFAIIIEGNGNILSMGDDGLFNEVTGDKPFIHRMLFPKAMPTDGGFINKAYTASKNVQGLATSPDDNFEGYTIHIRIYGSGGSYQSLIHTVSLKFSSVNEKPKGNLYKTTQGSNFTKLHDIETTIFGDYIASGWNGYFYSYPIDDTSSLYRPTGELHSGWTAYGDPDTLPLLQHITRQKSRMFSVAHDLLSADITASNFDPLSIFVDCDSTRYVVVSARFDFLRSNVSVELEEVAYTTNSKRDYIYSYFGDGEEGIRSIGGISGGSGGGSGGGLTSEQLEILSFWKKDPDRENTIFTEMNAYSKLELSAYGAGDGGSGGGGEGVIETVYGYGNLGQTFNNSILTDTFNAYTINSIHERVQVLEAGGGGGGSDVEWGTLTNGYRQLTVEGVTYALAQNTHKHLWADITDKPSTFTPSAHSHGWSEITGKPSTFTPSAHTHSAGDITSGTFAIARIPTGTTGTTVALGNHLHTGVYEPTFSKNTAFNKDFGTTSGTVAQGNDSRINNGQTAYGWGNHASAGYALNSAFNTHNNDNVRHITGAERTKWDGVVTDFAGLEIGGVNLLINSKNYTLSNPIFAESTATDSGMDENFWIITLGSAYLQINIPQKIAVGERFAFSFIHTRKTNTAQDFQVAYGSEIKQFNSKSDVQKFVFTAVKTSDSYLRLSRVLGGSGWTLRIDELQLEKGNKATDWSPAPEDQVSDWNTTDVNSFSFIKNKPTTLSGYGITDAVTLNTAQTISGAKTFSSALTASISVTTPKVIFAAAGWSLEQSGTELQMKYNGTAKMRFLSGGSIVATQEITAYS